MAKKDINGLYFISSLIRPKLKFVLILSKKIYILTPLTYQIKAS